MRELAHKLEQEANFIPAAVVENANNVVRLVDKERISQVQIIPRASTFVKSYRGIANNFISNELEVEIIPEDQEKAGKSTVVSYRNAIFRDISLVLDPSRDLRELDLVRSGKLIIVEEHSLADIDPENDPHHFGRIVGLYNYADLSHAIPKIMHVLRPTHEQIINIVESSKK